MSRFVCIAAPTGLPPAGFFVPEKRIPACAGMHGFHHGGIYRLQKMR